MTTPRSIRFVVCNPTRGLALQLTRAPDAPAGVAWLEATLEPKALGFVGVDVLRQEYGEGSFEYRAIAIELPPEALVGLVDLVADARAIEMLGLSAGTLTAAREALISAAIDWVQVATSPIPIHRGSAEAPDVALVRTAREYIAVREHKKAALVK